MNDKVQSAEADAVSPEMAKYDMFARILSSPEAASVMNTNGSFNNKNVGYIFGPDAKRDSYTAMLQELLTEVTGVNPTQGLVYDLSGSYWQYTLDGVKQYQTEKKLARKDGFVDEQTLSALVDDAMKKANLSGGIASLKLNEVPRYYPITQVGLYAESGYGVNLIDLQRVLLRLGAKINPAELAAAADWGKSRDNNGQGNVIPFGYLTTVLAGRPDTLRAVQNYLKDHPNARTSENKYYVLPTDTFSPELVQSLNEAAADPAKDKAKIKAAQDAAANKPTDKGWLGIIQQEYDDAKNYLSGIINGNGDPEKWLETDTLVADVAKRLQTATNKEGKAFLDKDVNIEKLTRSEYQKIKKALEDFQHYYFDDENGKLTRGIIAGQLDAQTYALLKKQSDAALKAEEQAKAEQKEKAEKEAKAKEEAEKKKAEAEKKETAKTEEVAKTEKKEDPAKETAASTSTTAAKEEKKEEAKPEASPSAGGERKAVLKNKIDELKARVGNDAKDLDAYLKEYKDLEAAEKNGAEKPAAGAGANPAASPGAAPAASPNPAPAANAQLSPVMEEIGKALQNIFEMLAAMLKQLAPYAGQQVALSAAINTNAQTTPAPAQTGAPQVTADGKYRLVPVEEYKLLTETMVSTNAAIKRNNELSGPILGNIRNNGGITHDPKFSYSANTSFTPANGMTNPVNGTPNRIL